MRTKLIYTFLAVFCFGLLAQPCDVYVVTPLAKIETVKCNKQADWDVSLSGQLGFLPFD